MLYCGEQIGDGAQDPKVDIAVDPLDGTTLISQARPELLALTDMLLHLLRCCGAQGCHLAP